MKEHVFEQIKRINLVTDQLMLLSHPIRLRILRLLAESDASWSELDRELEKIWGRLNPNTLNFHLTKLVNGGFVEKRGERFALTEKAKKSKILKAVLSELEVANIV